MELSTEQAIKPNEVYQTQALVFVPAGVLYYESLKNISMAQGQNRAEQKLSSKGSNFHHIETDAQGKFLPLTELDPNNPDDKNKVEVKGRGLYVKVKLDDQSFWVRYNELPKKGQKRPHYHFA